MGALFSGETMLDFVQPAQSKILVSLAQFGWPLYAQIRYPGIHLEVSQDVLEAFGKTRGEGTIICANHSAEEDPEVLFGLSGMVREKFYFLTAREIFGGKTTFASKWLQLLGCFSVERGLADINAFRAIRDLLIRKAKIVIFPEGEISHKNEHLMDLENGPERTALSALSEIEVLDQTRSIFIMPLAIDYRFRRSTSPKLESTLEKLERLLGRCCRPGESIRIRLEKVFDILLSKLEKRFHCHTDKSSRLGERWRLLREGIIHQCETLIDMKLSDDLPQLRRIHILKIGVRRWITEHRKMRFGINCLNRAERDTATLCHRQLVLATNLTSIGEHSFDHQLTQAESTELIAILELALCERNSVRRPDVVAIRAGDVIDVKQFSHLYAISKQEGIGALKAKLRQEIAQALLRIDAIQPQDAAAAKIAR